MSLTHSYKGYIINAQKTDESPRRWAISKMVCAPYSELPNEIEFPYGVFTSFSSVRHWLDMKYGYVVSLWRFNYLDKVYFALGSPSPEWYNGIGGSVQQVGFVVATKNVIKQALHVRYVGRGALKKFTAMVEDEIREYENFLRGNCWYYTITNVKGDKMISHDMYGTPELAWEYAVDYVDEVLDQKEG